MESFAADAVSRITIQELLELELLEIKVDKIEYIYEYFFGCDLRLYFEQFSKTSVKFLSICFSEQPMTINSSI